ncbi:MAG TPA: S9 family peptidase [Thermoanaerobaculia bacterium]|nr:S9 family peptidase [Thermoanaerobaculia bacterium]
MKKLALTVALLIASAASAQRPMNFEDLASMRRIGAPKVSPDGKWIVYDASTIDLDANVRRSAIYLIPADGSAAPRQLTDGKKQDEGPSWSPDGKTIAYVSNREGGAKQVYLLDVAAGTSRKLTTLAGGAGAVKWVPTGTGLVLVSDVHPDCGVDPACTEQKDTAAEKAPSKARVIDSLLYRHWNAWQAPTRAHIIHVPLSGAPRDLTPGAFDAPPFSVGGGDEFDVSPDGRELVYARNVEANPERSTNSDLYIVPLASTSEPKRITSRTGADTSPSYSPDGRYIAYRSQSRNGYESDLWELWLYDRAAGTSRRIAPDFPNWISELAWSPDSKSLIIDAPLKGKNALYEITLPANGTSRTTLLDNSGSAGSIDVAPDGKTIYFSLSTLRRPADIYSLTRGGKLTRLTRENDARLSEIAMGTTEDVWWEGADGAQIQGHLVKPPNFDPKKKYPAIVLIHGGPQGAWSDSWSYRWNPQPFAARGYVILMPNPRGSSGFGQQFVEQISRDWAGRVYTDIMNGVDKLAAMPYVDGSRLGAAGGSYGGYMVNWILGHSNRFKALVSHAGVYNLESMAGVTEELWFTEWEFGGPYWDNPEDYQKWSPHRFAKNFATPTLVTHGELDFRVPIGEGLQLFTALQRKGVPSRLLYFPDEGHWVLKPQNSKLWFQTVGDWFDQWLKK